MARSRDRGKSKVSGRARFDLWAAPDHTRSGTTVSSKQSWQPKDFAREAALSKKPPKNAGTDFIDYWQPSGISAVKMTHETFMSQRALNVSAFGKNTAVIKYGLDNNTKRWNGTLITTCERVSASRAQPMTSVAQSFLKKNFFFEHHIGACSRNRSSIASSQAGSWEVYGWGVSLNYR